MRGLSLRIKVFFLFAGAALLIVVPTLLYIAQEVEQPVYERATEELRNAATTLGTGWDERGSALQSAAQADALDRDLVAAWEAGRLRRVRQLVQAGSASKVPALSFAVDSLGETLFGPELSRAALRQAELAAGPVVVRGDSGVALRVAVAPVQGDSGLLGWVGKASRLDPEGLRALKKSYTPSADVVLLLGDSLAGTTFSAREAAGLRDPEVRADLANVQAGRHQVVTLGDSSYRAGSYALQSRGSRIAVILFRPIDQELAIANGIRRTLLGVGFAAPVLALLLAAVVARIVARPTQALAEASARLARGDYRAPLPRDSGDEIGQLSRAFGEMRAAIAEREGRLRSAQAEMIHREKLAAMGRLVAQLSHEINNPIYNIQNCLEALERRGDPNEPNREFLTLAQEELARLAVLTRQLLDQSRPLSDAAQPVSLNTLAQRVLTLAGAELRARGVRVEAELAPDLPLVVAHPEGIQQVLANLVSNAGDAMPGGGVLRVVTRAGADAVEMVVEDTGSGIAEEDLPHIFEAFYTTKPGVTGLGLGLFVSEGIIRGHRGRLSVESAPGKGSRFTVRLPRETLDETLAEAGAGEAEPAAEPAAV